MSYTNKQGKKVYISRTAPKTIAANVSRHGKTAYDGHHPADVKRAKALALKKNKTIGKN